MQNIRDLTGQKFNNLTAIKIVGKDNQNKTLWLFKCDCGNEKVMRGTNVTSGHIKSCGCKARGMNLKNTEKQKHYTKNIHGDKLRAKTDLYKNNKSGITGIHQRKSDGRYSCSICINGVVTATTKNTFYDAVKWRELILQNKKETIEINGKQVPLSKLPCNKCKWRYSIHCPKCEWNKDGKYKVY